MWKNTELFIYGPRLDFHVLAINPHHLLFSPELLYSGWMKVWSCASSVFLSCRLSLPLAFLSPDLFLCGLVVFTLLLACQCLIIASQRLNICRSRSRSHFSFSFNCSITALRRFFYTMFFIGYSVWPMQVIFIIPFRSLLIKYREVCRTFSV